MSDLTAAELTAMRADVAGMLLDTCTIQTRTATVNAIGEAAYTWANTYTGVACRLDPPTLQADAGLQLRRQVSSSDYTLTVAYDQTLDATMRVIVDSETYEVAAVDTGKSWDVSKRATLRRAV